MEKNDLIERYLYAVTKYMDHNTKNDVYNELKSIIMDMLDERCHDTIPTEKDVRVVLTELGTPNELADKYSPHADKCLIGAPYFVPYIYVLKIIGICVIFGIVLAQIISGVINQTEWYVVLIEMFGSIICGLIFSYSFITIMFTFFYHKNISMNTLYDSIDNLPPVPKDTSIIPKWEPVCNIAFSIIFVIIFLFCPQIICGIFIKEGISVAIFNIDYINAKWYLITLFALAGIIRECVKIIDKRYTKRLMLTTIAVDILSAIIAMIWMLPKSMMNTEFKAVFEQLFKGNNSFIADAFGNFNYFLFAIIIFALVLDLFTTVYRTLKAQTK